VNGRLTFGYIPAPYDVELWKFSVINAKLLVERIAISVVLAFPLDDYVFKNFLSDVSFVQWSSQGLAIQGLGMIVSFWPDWVILPYIIGAELTVE
jgi:hypothetical protein